MTQDMRTAQNGSVLRLWFVAPWFLAIALPTVSMAAAHYALTDLEVLQGSTAASRAFDINELGHIVGVSIGDSGNRAFFWTASAGMQDLGVGIARALNESDQTVGYDFGGDAQSPYKAVIWPSQGAAQPISEDAFRGIGWAINESVEVAGNIRSQSGESEAFRWTSVDGLQKLGFLPNTVASQATDINDNGQVVGASGNLGFLWTEASGMKDLGLPMGATLATAQAINNSGDIVGRVFTNNGSNAFLWMRGGEMHSLGDLPGSTHPVGFDSGLASDINDLGQVVGQSDTPTGDHAFLWTSDEGMQDLNDLLDASGAGWRLLAAEGINNAGQIVGYGLSDAGAIRAFLLTPVTPATPTWKVDADGNWSEAANWTVGTPNAAGVQATLGAIITVPRAITLDSPTTIGSLDFISSATYTIAGANPLTFNSTEGQAKVMVVSGSHRVDAPVVLADNTLVDIAAADSSLSINGGITAIGATLTKTGPGMLTVNQLNIAAVVIDDGTLRLKSDGPPSQASVIGTLNIAGQAAPTARLDLNDALIIDYSGTSPAETIRQQILVGRGGTGLGKPWNGNGISSSAAAAANATEPESISVGYADNGTLPLGSYAMFRGQAVDATSLLVARTRTGDANLDGVVNDEDVTIISATYAPGVSQPSWSLGDFDYSGTVDDDDVTLLGAFYDPGAPPLSGEGGAAVAAIPEPRAALLALWGLAVTAIRYRCRCSIWRRGHA